MAGSYEVVIVGGGVMGCAVAYFVAADPSFQGRILVLERDPSYEFASTPLSWGGYRQQYSTPENIRMAAFSIPFLKSAHQTLAVDGEGKLYMSCGTGCDAEFRRKVETWTDLPDGAFYEFHVITRDDVTAREIQEQTLRRHSLQLIGLRGLIDECMAGRWKRGDPDYRQKLERRQDELNSRRRQERQRQRRKGGA